jgi:hypothetical protein
MVSKVTLPLLRLSEVCWQGKDRQGTTLKIHQVPTEAKSYPTLPGRCESDLSARRPAWKPANTRSERL